MHCRILYHVLRTLVVTVNYMGVVIWCVEVKWFDRCLVGQSKGSAVNLLVLL